MLAHQASRLQSQNSPGLLKSTACDLNLRRFLAPRYLLAEKKFSNIVIYEQRATIGGAWNYDTPLDSHDLERESGGSNVNGISNGDHEAAAAAAAQQAITTDIDPGSTTPMYDGLEANLPHMLMQFSDVPFPENTQLFPSRQCVMDYLAGYAKELRPMLRLNHEVTDIRPADQGVGHESGGQWLVTTKSNGNSSTERFDAVVIANGHSYYPALPAIKGLDEWAKQDRDSLMHAVSYRNPEMFRDKANRPPPSFPPPPCENMSTNNLLSLQRVLIVGGGPSGADIGQQIAQVCKPPLLSAQVQRSPYHLPEPDEVEVDHPTLVGVDRGSCRRAMFEDGSVEQDIDIILLCTGYDYSFPFLSSVYPQQGARVEAEGGDRNGNGGDPSIIHRIHPYQYIFPVSHPSLAFIETLEGIVPFPMAEAQAAVVARVWSGRLQLPSEASMHAWVEGKVSEKGSGRGYHAVPPPQDLVYMREMYDWIQPAAAAEAERERGSVRMGEGEGEGEMVGKTPRHWDDYYCWLRMTAAEMKKAWVVRRREPERAPEGGFEGKDQKGKKVVTTYEQLGFRFEGQKVL